MRALNQLGSLGVLKEERGLAPILANNPSEEDVETMYGLLKDLEVPTRVPSSRLAGSLPWGSLQEYDQFLGFISPEDAVRMAVKDVLDAVVGSTAGDSGA